MPNTKIRFSKCGHRGHGGHCHRCAEADRLEAMVDVPKTKRSKSFQDWTKEQLLAEAARLRGPQGTRARHIEPTAPEPG